MEICVDHSAVTNGAGVVGGGGSKIEKGVCNRKLQAVRIFTGRAGFNVIKKYMQKSTFCHDLFPKL